MPVLPVGGGVTGGGSTGGVSTAGAMSNENTAFHWFS